MSGASLIAAERERQIADKGYTPNHDDTHTLGQLAEGATCYAYAADYDRCDIPPNWPFEDPAWKPCDDPIRNLVKAGAMIAAEIDRLQRMPKQQPQQNAV